MNSSSESSTNPITIVIADDHPVVREGLVEVFKSQADIKVVAEATNGEDTLEMCNQHLPAVLLLDFRMPRKDGLQVMTELAARTASRPRVIVMTTYDSEDDIHRSVKAGAKGYLVKDTAPQQIRESVRRVAAGESILSSNIADKLAKSIVRPQLSKRERQVLNYLANGRSNKEIAQILYISEHTAKAHVRSIMTKLNAENRTEVIAIGARHGLIKGVPG
ncbi:MAG: response regulator transcription factor [Verrucomicrobia bacterium]|nr:response regulator transcription factor [Verrucomicrobiota bacterium]